MNKDRMEYIRRNMKNMSLPELLNSISVVSEMLEKATGEKKYTDIKDVSAIMALGTEKGMPEDQIIDAALGFLKEDDGK